MTRKDYNGMAMVLDEVRKQIVEMGEAATGEVVLQGVAAGLREICAADNPRFDRARFNLAAGLTLDGKIR